jgi:phage terminase large subunit-like protein
LSSTTDLTGLVLLVEPETEGDPWHLVPFCWLPDEGLDQKEKTDRVPYRAWKSGGYLDTTPGKAISKLAIVKKLVEISRFFDLQAVAFDRWRIEDLKSMADDNDIDLPNMTPFGQGYKDMSPAIEAFETELLNGRVIHPGNPVFTWCAANAVTTSDDAENRKLSKEKATGRIDLIVAAVMAVGCHAGTAKNGTSSFFESFAK